ncbi:MAG: methyltransferase domain-containing protein [Candidatus Nealsonbacteria bacterium]|nr:methyltransferase domain-containing protein [Candidatus Nealsonbacteria bacterium]
MKPKPKKLREGLVKKLVKGGAIKSKEVKDAFQKVPRHIFLPDIEIKKAYKDSSFITKKIGIDPLSSSTQPSLMAPMLENLRVQKGMEVLEMGAGTGYNAAILSELVGEQGKIFTLDIDKDTVEEARSNLISAGYKNVRVECADGEEGLPQHAPYDRIIATCSIKNFPEPWINQLKEEGIIVTPIWLNGAQVTPAFKKEGGILISFSVTQGGFMELRSRPPKEMLVKQNDSQKLLICTEHLDLFKEEEVTSLLRKNYQEESLPSDNMDLCMRRYDFFIFLSLHDKNSIELFLEKNNENLGFRKSALGIINLKRESACLISKDCKLLKYGSSYAYKRVLELIHKWDKLNRPSIDQLKFLVYSKNNKLAPTKKKFLFKKESSSTLCGVWIKRFGS